MRTIRLCVLMGALVAATAFGTTSPAWAQKKYSISEASAGNSQYLQEHAIDVGDRPGHQVRIYEIRNEYPKKDLAFAGIIVKDSLVRGMSDYTNWSGPFTTYGVYTLEDGSKIFSRSTGTTQTESDGTRKFTFVENFAGGTGKFASIRGQLRGSGERAGGAKTLTSHSSGEYWLEE
jgi:hypothetical protein